MLVSKVDGPGARAGSHVQDPTDFVAWVTGRRGSQTVVKGQDEQVMLKVYYVLVIVR